MNDQRAQAQRLRSLHEPGNPVVFVNVWDAASARVIESLGCPAVATSSAAVAFSEGFPDGERIGLVGMLASITRISRAVSIPVTADLEGGYGDTIESAVATAKGAIAAGAAGLNFEDGHAGSSELVDARHQAARIAAIRQVANDFAVPLVINARTDVIFNDVGPEADRMRETIERARLYHANGADCIFVPGVSEPAEIAQLVREIGAPLNVLTGPRAPSVAEMAKLGVARLSYGVGPYLVALTAFRDAAKAVRDGGTYDAPAAPMSYPEVNALFD